MLYVVCGYMAIIIFAAIIIPSCPQKGSKYTKSIFDKDDPVKLPEESVEKLIDDLMNDV